MTFSLLPHRDALGLADCRLLVDGRWTEASEARRLRHVHPSTNEDIVAIGHGSAEDVDCAVRAARRAFDQGPWPRLPARERRRALQRIAVEVERQADALAAVEALDTGTPIRASRASSGGALQAADIFDHYAGWVDKIGGEVYPVFTAEAPLQFISFREPVGVVGIILSSRAPLLGLARKLAPALASGCTAVVKPSEYASLAALRLAEIIAGCELPPGVLNVVTGDAATGEAIVAHAGVDKLAFAGSRELGGQILAASGRDIKRVSLDLDGRGSSIVFPDAPSIADAAATAMLSVSTCAEAGPPIHRVIVHRSVLEAFIDEAQRASARVRFGSPFDASTTSAPLAHRRELDLVLHGIDQSRAWGARLVFGGTRPGDRLAAGNWIDPTVIADVEGRLPAGHAVSGPVLTVTPFESEADALRLANAGRPALATLIHSRSTGRVIRLARDIRTGMIGVNGLALPPNAPYGGLGRAGLGRSGSLAAIEACTELKTVIVNTAA